MSQALWELTYPKPVSPKAWAHPEPKDPENGCFPGCVTCGPFGSGQHFSVSPRGVLCLGGWDGPRSLERPGPHAGHCRGSTIGPRPTFCSGFPGESGNVTGPFPAHRWVLFALICVFIF